MGEKIKIGFYEKESQRLRPFIKEDLQPGVPLKFIQVYIDDGPLLRVGKILHKKLLERVLNEFSISFNKDIIPLYKSGKVICDINDPENFAPLMKGNRYEMVGAGSIGLDRCGTMFWGNSIHYSSEERILDTDKEHLEKMGIKILEGNNYQPHHFVVDIDSFK